MDKMYKTAWVSELHTKYKSGIANAFIIAGNIGDYAITDYKIEPYLGRFLDETLSFDEIAFFNVVNGAIYRKTKGGDEGASRDGENLATICEKIKRHDAKRAYIVSYPSLMIPTDGRYLQGEDKSNLVTLHQTLNSNEFVNSDNIIIFLCESVKDMHEMFVSSNSRTYLINLTLPTEKEREKYINDILGDNTRGYSYRSEITNSQFAKLTAGLSLINIEDIVLQANNEGSLTKKMILERKKELIRKEYSEIIELYDTDGYGLDSFAGQEHIKEYFKDVVIDAIKDDNLEIVPKGVLLMGPPGTGKTYFSRCLAGDAGINFVEFKMSKILDKWVGESERKLEKAFSVFRALAPVGVFIDEVDQALSRGDNESNSVSKNMFGMFLAELSKAENRGRIVWLGATNYPDRLDDAFKRSGRFDKKIPFFAPEYDERAAVFKIHLNKAKLPISKDVNCNKLAGMTEGYTQAEIENIVVKALEMTRRKKLPEINQDTLEKALGYMLTAQSKNIKEMEDIALKECNDLELLPEKYLPRLKALRGM